MQPVTIYTDGACTPNPGRGGWSAIIVAEGEAPITLSGGKDWTTNNEMELTGILRGLEWLAWKGVEGVIVSDSRYAIDCISVWSVAWERQGWKKKKAKAGPILNLEIIQAAFGVAGAFRVGEGAQRACVERDGG
jgi:ribonuclease HI